MKISSEKSEKFRWTTIGSSSTDDDIPTEERSHLSPSGYFFIFSLMQIHFKIAVSLSTILAKTFRSIRTTFQVFRIYRVIITIIVLLYDIFCKVLLPCNIKRHGNTSFMVYESDTLMKECCTERIF